MNVQKSILSATMLATLVLSGCSATKARINENEDLFNSYSPNVQAMIKSNRIDEGFDTTQVYLACGNANRTESEGEQEVWYYHDRRQNTVREEKTAAEYRLELVDYEKAVEKGNTHLSEPTTYRTVRYYRTKITRTVRFEEGVVVAWEEPQDQWLDEWHR